jgi:2-methylcitrate dehydratase PrpD
MGSLHASLDAIFDIMAKRPLQPDEIERIDIDMPHAGYHHGWWQLERPVTPIAAQMNVAYAVAVAILDGAAMVQQFAPQRSDRDDVWRLIPRITAHHDPEFDKVAGRGRSARMTVTLKDGTRIEHFTEVARTIGAPLSDAQVVAKYRVLTDGIITPGRQREIEERVLNLETMASTVELSRLLAPVVEPVFRNEERKR